MKNPIAILVKLFQAGQPMTAAELGISPVVAGRLREQDGGLLVIASERRIANRRGRPQFEYKLSRKGRDRARRAVAKTA